MLAVRVLRVAVQPALEVKTRDQLRGVMIAQLLLALREKLAARVVNALNFAFQIQGEERFRHGFQQRAQRQVLTLGRHPGNGAYIRNASDTADFRHQAAEGIKFNFGKIEVNSPDRIDLNAT